MASVEWSKRKGSLPVWRKAKNPSGGSGAAMKPPPETSLLLGFYPSLILRSGFSETLEGGRVLKVDCHVNCGFCPAICG
jgi:hypothetical protein